MKFTRQIRLVARTITVLALTCMLPTTVLAVVAYDEKSGNECTADQASKALEKGWQTCQFDGNTIRFYGDAVPEPGTIITGKTWQLRYVQLVDPKEYGRLHMYSFYEYKLGDDVKLNGKNYKPLLERGRLLYEDMPRDWEVTNLYYREENGTVYQFVKTDGQEAEKVIVNFNLSEGDKFSAEPGINYVVTQVSDTVLASATTPITCKCLHITNEDDPTDQDVWVEGIGSLRTGIGLSRIGFSEVPRLLDCRDENNYFLYQSEELHQSPLFSMTVLLGIYTQSKIPTYVWPMVTMTLEINNRKYRELNMTPVGGLTYYYRVEGKKVYRISDKDSQEKLMFDYGLKENDTFWTADNKRLIVTEVSDTLLLPYRTLRVLHLQETGNPENTDTWIEGLGSIHTGLLLKKDVPYMQLEEVLYSEIGDVFFTRILNRDEFKSATYTATPDLREKTPPHYEFEGDVLHVTGQVRSGRISYASCFVSPDNKVLLHFVPFLGTSYAGEGIAKIDLRFPGFKAGRYTIGEGMSYSDDPFRPNNAVELECKGLSTGSKDISIDGQVADTSLPLYDLTGRRISDTSVLPKGVYIQGGKKVLVK